MDFKLPLEELSELALALRENEAMRSQICRLAEMSTEVRLRCIREILAKPTPEFTKEMMNFLVLLTRDDVAEAFLQILENE